MTFEYTIYSTLEECLAGADIIVEATRFEENTLYATYLSGLIVTHHASGWVPTVGHIYKKPICISTMFATINNKFVLFWYPISRMVDHNKIEEYFKKYCREDVKRVECYSFSPQLFN